MRFLFPLLVTTLVFAFAGSIKIPDPGKKCGEIRCFVCDPSDERCIACCAGSDPDQDDYSLTYHDELDTGSNGDAKFWTSPPGIAVIVAIGFGVILIIAVIVGVLCCIMG